MSDRRLRMAEPRYRLHSQRMRIKGFLAAVTVAVLAVVAVPAPAFAEVGYYRLFQNRYSGKCLEIPYGSTANFAQAGQYDCYGGPIEQWNYSTTTGLIQNVNSGKCLEVLYYSTANFAPVGQYDCYGGANQQWYFNRSNGLIANRHSGKCLEVLYYATHNFAPVGQYDCYGGANQQWWW
ncbi:MAG TPA: hypothetical protein DGT23_18665 [Micromonosporaceae bacterium]|nr:hypothetical protein [Micromonosporaceae bacterium]